MTYILTCKSCNLMNDNKELPADNADAKLFIRTMSLCYMIIIVDTD